MGTTTIYVHEGATLTATLDIQGTVVPVNAKRVIKSAALVNTTAAPVLCSVSFVSEDASVHPKIVERALGVNESYLCPELIGKGLLAGGSVKASGLGVSFDYTSTEIVGG